MALVRTLWRALIAVACILAWPLPSTAQPGCDPSDIANEESVYQCMMAGRRAARPTRDPVLIGEQANIRDCSKAGEIYVAIMRRAGMSVPRDSVREFLPSCTTFARVLERINGTPPPWHACTNYPGRFEPEHMKACLSEFLPAYYGGALSLDTLKGCGDAIGKYEKALALASHRQDLAGGQLAGYQQPNCQAMEKAGIVQTTVAAVVPPAEPASPAPGTTAETPTTVPAATAPAAPTVTPSEPVGCSSYEPTDAHMRRCLGGEMGRYTGCRELRRAYEDRLRQYFGGLPTGYQAPDCKELDPIVAENKARREVPYQGPPLVDHRTGGTDVPKDWNEVFWRIAAWLNWKAFACHMAVFIAGMFYTRKLIANGELTFVRLQAGKLLSNPRVSTLVGVGHVAAFFIGYNYLAGNSQEEFPKWIISGGLALPAAVVLVVILMFTGFFSGGRSHRPESPGPTRPPPKAETPPTKQRSSKQRGDEF